MAREKGMELILKRMKTIAPSVPVVLTGDMNATSDSKPIKLATSVLWDTAAISKSPHAGPLSTYNGFNVKKVPEVCIDYLFVSKGITVLAHATLDDSENGLYPSDHFPVVADLLLD
jgi:endonuclease/exonuclease/phosphatase family metal-dependent hydrolase